MTARKPHHPVTPDGRYFVVRGRLWRMSDPSLSTDERDRLVNELMSARRPAALEAVDCAKRALGERDQVWWDDRSPDLKRHMARTTVYAEWFAGLGKG